MTKAKNVQEELDIHRRKQVLVAVTLFGENKKYVVPKFLEMYDACIRPFNMVATVIYGDHNIDTHPTGLKYQHMQSPGWYAEDMLMASREQARLDAIERDVDIMVWHGIDALWQSPKDFAKMLNTVTTTRRVVAPLISARNWADQPVTRRFVPAAQSDVNDPVQYTQVQTDVPDDELLSNWMIPTGFPGADNIFIPREYFDLSLTDGHDPWYKRVEEGRVNVCCEENWIWNLLNRESPNHPVYCDTSVKVWHVHEDGRANMYKGITKRLEDLSWQRS